MNPVHYTASSLTNNTEDGIRVASGLVAKKRAQIRATQDIPPPIFKAERLT